MGSHHSWKQPLSVVSSAQLLPPQQLSASQVKCHMGQQPCCISFCWVLCRSGSRTHWESSWRDFRELVWPLKFNIEQPSIVLNPCLHLIFASERKLTSIIAYTVLTNNVLVSAVHLFGDTENTITICGHCGEFLFLCLRVCQPGSMFCHALSINVDSFCLLGLCHHASFLQGTVDLEPYMLLLYSFTHLLDSTTRFLFSTGSSLRGHKLWWHHPARDPSALTKLTEHDLQYQHLHQKQWQLQLQQSSFLSWRQTGTG